MTDLPDASTADSGVVRTVAAVVSSGLFVDSSRALELREAAHEWRSWDLDDRQLCEFEMLASGAYAPLVGYLRERDHTAVLADLRLHDGTLWPVPITLDVDEDLVDAISVGAQVALRDPEGTMLAALHVQSIFSPDRAAEALAVFGTDDPAHPGVERLLHHTHEHRLGGRLEVLQRPNQYDFDELRRTPGQVRARLADLGWQRVVSFHTRNPMHRAEVALTHEACDDVDAGLLLLPTVGESRPGDVDHFTRVRTYRHVLDHYHDGAALLSLSPDLVRFAGPREALLHAIVHRNHGATHLVVGPDHAGPGLREDGTPWYAPAEARELVAEHADELGIEVLAVDEYRWVPSLGEFRAAGTIPPDTASERLTGTQGREALARGRELPDWYSYPDVLAELARTYPPRADRGITIFFTGLSGSGKSTVANVLRTKLLELGGRTVTLLDGDLVRHNLSSELTFSKAHRDVNVLRIGWVASEITKHGGIAICAPIAPYDAVRRRNRRQVESTGGGYVLVHVSTPLEVCEERDRKGLYAKARAGIIKGFTGIDDPYEEPSDADVEIDTSQVSAEHAAERVLDHLRAEGWLAD